MRVLIDAHMVGSRETGNETYVKGLLEGLSSLGDVTCGAAVVRGAVEASSLDNVELLPLDGAGNWTRLAYALPAMCHRWRPDVLHVTYTGPPFTSCPLVVSVHDASFKRHPDFFGLRDTLLFETLVPLTLHRASAVIVLSEHGKEELLGFFPFLKDRIKVTCLAPRRMFRPIADSELLQTACSRYGIRQRFVLAVGNLQPRKNLLRLIAAFADVRHQLKSVLLVVVGQEQWQASQLYGKVKDLGLEHAVLFAGYVPDHDLALLYNAATVFVYPSLYEGFGLPVLEAMACGTPVIVSNTSSLPEVAGDAAMLVDPYDVEQMAESMLTLLTQTELAQDLSIRGLQRARRFSWAKTAQQTVAVYRDVLEKASPR